jgi:hypothetical protein
VAGSGTGAASTSSTLNGCYAAYRYAWFLMTLSYSQTWQQALVQGGGDFDQALLQMVLSYWFSERVRKAVFRGNASHGGARKYGVADTRRQILLRPVPA